jgi:hypothetical protein
MGNGIAGYGPVWVGMGQHDGDELQVETVSAGRGVIEVPRGEETRRYSVQRALLLPGWH